MSPAAAVAEPVRFPAVGGYDLAGIYQAAAEPSGEGGRAPPAAGAAVVLCHGMLSSKESEKLVRLAAALATRGIASLRFDFSGRGESGGERRRILYTQEVADLGAAAAWLRSHGHRRLGLFGSSMGGAVAALHAAGDPTVAALVTLAAVARPGHFRTRVAAGELDRWRAQGFFVYDGAEIDAALLDDCDRVDVLAAARSLRIPLLVLHGGGDQVVPAEDGRLLAQAGRGELVLYPGGDHRFTRAADLDDALARAAAFLGGHLRWPRP